MKRIEHISPAFRRLWLYGPEPKGFLECGLKIRWLLRETAISLLDALQSSAIPATNHFVVFGAQPIETATARACLLAQGLAKQEFWAQAY